MIKRHIITTLLSAMDYHNYDNTLTKNGCIILYLLGINDQDMVCINIQIKLSKLCAYSCQKC